MNGVLTRFFATHANILSSIRSTMGHPFRFGAYGMLSYRSILMYEALSFGVLLSPDTFSAQRNLTSELLRFL